MEQHNTERLQRFKAFIAATDDTYVFDGETAVDGFGLLFAVIQEMGLDPMRTADLRRALWELFHIEVVNLPDLERGRFVLTPNHVSDLDALLLGVLHPRMRIVAKNGWMDNAKLRRFLDVHYDLCSLDRASVQSLRALLSETVRYFEGGEPGRHFLVFSQGTISDFNHNSPARISTIAQKISVRTGVPIVNVFVEQASLYHPTRIVFDEPVHLAKKDDFRTLWLEREAAMQGALVPPARMPRLTDRHANNNKPGDPHF